MEKEREGQLPFLDVMVLRKTDLRLGHKVYRKPTHTDRYLHKNSNHHPWQKRGIIKTLVDRANRNCEAQFLNTELDHLNWALQANGYSKNEITRAIKPRKQHRTEEEKQSPTNKVFLPYIKGVTDRMGKLLEKHNLQTVFKPTTKIQQMLRSAKDRRDPLTTAGVYRIPCSCGQVYIGTTKRSIHTRIKEHERHCRLKQPEKSAVAEHAIKQTGHEILFHNTEILDNTSNHYVRLHREAIEIHKHQQNFNQKEECLKLNKTWLAALKNTECKRSTNSTQPQGQGITAHKRPVNETHQPQGKIISHPYQNNTSTTKHINQPSPD
ncbi:calmodulin-lysine N-methyltransferase isoform X3 [Pogona vitticeps]